MKTKSEFVINAIKNIEDYENMKKIEFILDLKDWHTIKHFSKIYKWKKYSKKEWLQKKVASFIRTTPSMKDDPIMKKINLNIDNIERLKVKVSYT